MAKIIRIEMVGLLMVLYSLAAAQQSSYHHPGNFLMFINVEINLKFMLLMQSQLFCNKIGDIATVRNRKFVA